jgi:pimeloyl-ACP methyl ester carboxylesterase
MRELAPFVARRLDAVTAEHASMKALFAYASDLLDRRSLTELPVEVLTGSRNFDSDDATRRRMARHACRTRQPLLSRRNRLVDSGHDVPFSAPEAIVAAIERVSDIAPH